MQESSTGPCLILFRASRLFAYFQLGRPENVSWIRSYRHVPIKGRSILLFGLAFHLNGRYCRPFGEFQTLKGHDLHSVEIGQPLHFVASRHHRHRKVGSRLTDGANHLAAHLLNPREYMLHASARLCNAMVPSLLALRERLVLLALPLNLASVPFAL